MPLTAEPVQQTGVVAVVSSAVNQDAISLPCVVINRIK